MVKPRVVAAIPILATVLTGLSVVSGNVSIQGAVPRHGDRASTSEIARLIGRLETGNPIERKQAEAAIIREGDGGLSGLRAALEGPTTPAQRKRLRVAIAAIRENRVLLGPLVSVHLKNAPLNVAFANICDAVNIQASEWGGYGPGKPILVNLWAKRQPFWRVMQKLALSTGYSPTYGMLSRVGGTLQYAKPGLLAKAKFTSPYRGFIVVAQSVGANASLQLAGSNFGNSRSLYVSLAVLPPPLRDCNIQFAQPSVSRAADNLHHDLLPHIREQLTYYGFGGSASQHTLVYNLTAQLLYPAHCGTKIAELRGYIPMVVQTKAEILTFHRLSTVKQSKTLDGFAVTVHKLRHVGGLWKLKVSATPTRGSTDLSSADFKNISRQVGDPANVFGKGAHGEDIPVANYVHEGDFRRQTNTVAFFRKPRSVVIRVFRGQLRLKIPFSFTNLPVP